MWCDDAQPDVPKFWQVPLSLAELGKWSGGRRRKAAPVADICGCGCGCQVSIAGHGIPLNWVAGVEKAVAFCGESHTRPKGDRCVAQGRWTSICGRWATSNVIKCEFASRMMMQMGDTERWVEPRSCCARKSVQPTRLVEIEIPETADRTMEELDNILGARAVD